VGYDEGKVDDRDVGVLLCINVGFKVGYIDGFIDGE